MTIVILGGTLLHAYVVWRAASVPFLARRLPRAASVGIGAGLWAGMAGALYLGHGAAGTTARALEAFGMTWLAMLFIATVTLLPVDLVTLFGLVFRRQAPRLRGCALAGAAVLSAFALVQGMRAPVVREHEVRLEGLPASLDGTVLVAVSDLHLGSVLGEGWLAARLAQVRALRPDVVVVLGDVFEGHGAPADRFLEELRSLSAPLGVWAVTGNHESHGRGGAGEGFLEKAGLRVLHDRWAEVAPGLVVAGVDDLTSRRRRGETGDPVRMALAGRPSGAAILLSHTPWEAERAAASGAGLMLSGHTHGGQIWPFGLLESGVYPLLAGRYEVDGMPVIVSRGTGTWGPRMRLFAPSEILRITLRGAGRSAVGRAPSPRRADPATAPSPPGGL
jgi:predicted MPP superfamily phosphohydrolase